MNTKHTPAPWTKDLEPYESKFGRKRYTIQVYKKELHCLAVVSSVNKEEAEANAKLIAAAPELLEALTEYVNLEQGHISKLTTTPAERLAKAIRAIKKATL